MVVPTQRATATLTTLLHAAFRPILETVVPAVAEEIPEWRFAGVDASIAPALDTGPMTSAWGGDGQEEDGVNWNGNGNWNRNLGSKDHPTRIGSGTGSDSSAYSSYSSLGRAGSLAVASLVTAAIRQLPGLGIGPLVGYSGLMLPVLEDRGLAYLARCGALRISTLLACSAVCGTGLDTVPVPGGSDPEDVGTRATMTRLFLDTWTLAYRLEKPLSVRLLPIPGAQPGDVAAFDSPYLVDSVVMDLDA
jgi:uncharacterized protein (UPF0210 family)